MSEWKIKGVVEGTEQKTAQQEEQAVLDKAVEDGNIEPEAAGQEVEETPKINLNDLKEVSEDKIEEALDTEPEAEVKETLPEDSDDSPLELVEENETDNSDTAGVERSIEGSTAAQEQEEVQPQVQTQELPENVEKLVKFMEETGGGIEDYINLNRDLENVKEGDLLREYYKQSKPWDSQEIEEYLEDNFSYDEEMDEPREVRAKKRAFKEELFNAKRFLEGNKDKYYADLKLRKQQEVPTEYQEAYEYYSEYKKGVDQNQKLTQSFLEKTDKVFNDDFKGFDFQVGNNKYRYKVGNVAQTKQQQSDIKNFVQSFLDSNGEVADAAAYHKALFTASNADKLAEHFYEQGRADAIRQSAKEAKNINMDPRKEGVIKTQSGKKYKVVTGDSSSKLKIKLKQ